MILAHTSSAYVGGKTGRLHAGGAGRLACLPERKTGLYVRNVETTRLVQDERGWLSLAG